MVGSERIRLAVRRGKPVIGWSEGLRRQLASGSFVWGRGAGCGHRRHGGGDSGQALGDVVCDGSIEQQGIVTAGGDDDASTVGVHGVLPGPH